jgi:hypothetical protein
MDQDLQLETWPMKLVTDPRSDMVLARMSMLQPMVAVLDLTSRLKRRNVVWLPISKTALRHRPTTISTLIKAVWLRLRLLGALVQLAQLMRAQKMKRGG